VTAQRGRNIDADVKKMHNEDASAALNSEMLADFHIIASMGEKTFTLQEQGLMVAREFSSLFEATQCLRREQAEGAGWVVIHDDEGHLNRIPLRLPT
jgi:hypothetical protein